MVRASAKNHANVAVLTSPDQYDELVAALGRGRHHAGAAPAPRRRRLRAHGDVRRRGRVLDGQRPRRHRATGDGLPGLDRRRRGTRPPTLRYGENPHQAAALYRSPGEGRSLAGARAAARQGDVLQQLRRRRRRAPGRVRLRGPGRRDHQARQPVRHRRRRRRGGGAPQGPRLRPGLGLRRRHRHERARQRGHGRAGRRGVHRGDPGAGLRGRRRRGAARARRTSASSSSSRWRPAGPSSVGSTAACWCSSATPSTPTTTRPPAGRWPAASRPTRRRWPTSSSPGRRAARSSRTRSCSPTTAPPSGIGMGQVNRVDSSRLAVTRAGDRAAGSVGGVGRVLPLPRRARDPPRGRRPRGRPARRLGARRRRRRGGARQAGATLYLTGARHFYH